MKLPAVDGTVLWLLPDIKSAAHYSSVIKELSRKYQSKVFIPHITLSRVPDWDLPQLKRGADRIAEGVSQFSLQAETVKCGNNPYQKITAGIKKTIHLENLFDATDAIFGGKYSKRKYPHLSLHYNTIPCNQFSEEVKNLNQKLQPILTIQQIALVSLKGAPNEWKVVYGKILKTNGQD